MKLFNQGKSGYSWFMLSHAERVASALEKGAATVINPLFVNILDTQMLDKLVEPHDVFVTFEDGSVVLDKKLQLIFLKRV